VVGFSTLQTWHPLELRFQGIPRQSEIDSLLSLCFLSTSESAGLFSKTFVLNMAHWRHRTVALGAMLSHHVAVYCQTASFRRLRQMTDQAWHGSQSYLNFQHMLHSSVAAMSAVRLHGLHNCRSARPA
jgi:hypothetical protein